jgi:hypothetical protein
MNQALMAMLPAEVRSALEAGAAPQDLMQSMLASRMDATSEVVETLDELEHEEPWPQVGWQFVDQPLVADSDATVSSFQRVADLAGALGACRLCLGESLDCPLCAGDGSPGWSVPDPELFEAIVVPALRRLQSEALVRAQRTARQAFGSEGRNGNGKPQTN